MSISLVDRFDDTLYEIAPWMIATAHHPDNLFGDVEPRSFGEDGLPVRRLLDKATTGPIAPMDGRGPWTDGPLLPVLRFKQGQGDGRTSIYVTYMRTRNNGRVLRQLSVEWSMNGAMRREEIKPYEAGILRSFEPLIVRFFPSLQLMETPNIGCSGVQAMDCIAVINQQTNAQTFRTPMYVHFAIDDDAMGASTVTTQGQRTRAQILGPDGRPARR